MSDDALRLRSTGLTWRNVAGELIVLDLDGSVYLAANGTGALVWDALSRGATRPGLVELVVECFGPRVSPNLAWTARQGWSWRASRDR